MQPALTPAPFWGVCRSLPKREDFAAERLTAGSFEVFLPLVQTKRSIAPLFTSYLSSSNGERSTAHLASYALSASAIALPVVLIAKSKGLNP
jgi:hypothetical protein